MKIKTKTQINTVKKITHGDIYWLNITNQGDKEIEYLRQNYKFHPLDLEDCLSPAQRPKVDQYPDYLFLILIFPFYNETKREIEASEVDFFITQKYLITVHNNQLKPLNEFFRLCSSSDSAREQFIDAEPSRVVYEILNRLLVNIFPLLDRISWQITGIEKRIFAGYEKRMVREILEVKKNIADLRRIMQAHKATIRKLMALDSKLFSKSQFKIYFDNLVEHTKDIWDNLDTLHDTINALHNTNESLISFRLNDIMKFLAIISVTMLPITVVASIFGMNSSFTPFADSPYGFWIVIGLCVLISLTFITFFKLKKWL